jgi:hypothetical protein
MAALDTTAALITLAALFSWANHRFIGPRRKARQLPQIHDRVLDP